MLLGLEWGWWGRGGQGGGREAVGMLAVFGRWAGEGGGGGGGLVVYLNRLCLLGGVVGWLVGEMVMEDLWRCCERRGRGGGEAGCRDGGVLIRER